MTTTDDALREFAASYEWLTDALHQAHLARWSTAAMLDDICDKAVWPAGKLLRPALLLTAASAVGGDVHDALPAALGVEYLHAASLVHDDIMDGGTLRRRCPSIPARFGTDAALLAGDELIFHAVQACGECAGDTIPVERVAKAIDVLAKTGAELCRGQYDEWALRTDVDADLETYCAVAARKTSALFEASCRIGAILGGGEPGQVTALTRFARKIGVAFQMIDDMRPYLHGAPRHDKDVLADIVCRTVTFPLVVARHELGAHTRPIIERAFDYGTSEEESYRLLATLVTDARVTAAATTIVGEWAGAAQDAL